MTITIEQHIEELRAEFRNACNRIERRQMEAELALALAERDRRRDAEPPS